MQIKVLIVDDNKDVTYSLQKGLKALNSEYLVFLANSGRECLEQLVRNNPDIVLLDIVMPDMDGWTIVERIHNSKTLSDIPIIFITGKVDDISQIVGTMSVEDYVVKPLDVKDLDKRIRRVLKR